MAANAGFLEPIQVLDPHQQAISTANIQTIPSYHGGYERNEVPIFSPTHGAAPVYGYASHAKALYQAPIPDSEWHEPNYSFEYGVNDPHTGDVKSQHETRVGDVVKGYYSLNEPDGTKRVVHYTADDVNGFQAIVEKIGHSVHPAKVLVNPAKLYSPGHVGLSYGSYAPSVPAYAPAPVQSYVPAPVAAYAPAPVASYAPAPVIAQHVPQIESHQVHQVASVLSQPTYYENQVPHELNGYIPELGHGLGQIQLQEAPIHYSSIPHDHVYPSIGLEGQGYNLQKVPVQYSSIPHEVSYPIGGLEGHGSPIHTAEYITGQHELAQSIYPSLSYH